MWNKDEWFMKEKSASLLDAMGLDMLSNKWAKQKTRNSFYVPRLIAQRPEFQRPENRVRVEKKKSYFSKTKKKSREWKFLHGISLHDSLSIFCARASRDCEASLFRSNLLLRMEFFRGEERLTFDINESKQLESWIHRSLINCWKNLKPLDFSSRVVRKLILRASPLSLAYSQAGDDVFRGK